MVDTQRMELDGAAAARVGSWAADVMAASYHNLARPPNAPETLERKEGDSPLVDTGRLVKAIEYRIERA